MIGGRRAVKQGVAHVSEALGCYCLLGIDVLRKSPLDSLRQSDGHVEVEKLRSLAQDRIRGQGLAVLSYSYTVNKDQPPLRCHETVASISRTKSAILKLVKSPS
jgi:hypothetical protein